MWAIPNASPWWLASGAAVALSAAVYLWLRRRHRGRTFAAELARQMEENAPDRDARLANLEARAENILALLYEVRDRLTWLENQVSALLSRTTPERGGGLQEEVCRAFDQGRPVTELARQFGRGKGEIELMLNLRRLKEGG